MISEGSVDLFCTPLQKKQWFDAFKETGTNVITKERQLPFRLIISRRSHDNQQILPYGLRLDGRRTPETLRLRSALHP